MPFFEHDGVVFHYTSQGEGMPLIFLHGLGGSVLQPQNTLGNISGCRQIYLDQRGHGQTPLGPADVLSYETLAADVCALADHLGLDRFCLGGISMGAAVSIKTTQLHPERVEKLVLVRIATPDGRPDPQTVFWYDVLTDYIKKRDREGFMQTDVFEQVRSAAPVTAETFLRLFEDGPSLYYPQKYRIIPRLRLLERMEDLKELHVPTLILLNPMDPVHAVEYGLAFGRCIPLSRCEEVAPKILDSKRHGEDVTARICVFLNAGGSGLQIGADTSNI